MKPGLYIATGIAEVRFLGGSGGGCMIGRLENGDLLLPLSTDVRLDLSGELTLGLPPNAHFLCPCKIAQPVEHYHDISMCTVLGTTVDSRTKLLIAEPLIGFKPHIQPVMKWVDSSKLLLRKKMRKDS